MRVPFVYLSMGGGGGQWMAHCEYDRDGEHTEAGTTSKRK